MDVTRVIEILSAYRGQNLPAGEIEIVPDLQIIDLYAARVTGQGDYLVHADSGSVEEVDFDGWPPQRTDEIDDSDSPAKLRGGMRIDAVMSRDVGHCRPDDTLDQAARLMWDRDCGCVPVCTGNGAARVVGMLTDRDICMAALFTGKPLGELRVYEAMSRDVRGCGPRDRATQVERAMRERQIRRVPVVDEEGGLIGIVSLADIARASGAPREAAAVSDAEIAGTLAAICRPRGAPRR